METLSVVNAAALARYHAEGKKDGKSGKSLSVFGSIVHPKLVKAYKDGYNLGKVEREQG